MILSKKQPMATMYLLLILCIVAVNASPNIVVIITDDQDVVLDGLTPMNKTRELIGERGKTFENAFANTPVCCPSRSSILTGKFAHNTGVTNNTIAGNCSSTNWQQYQEPFSIAALLQSSKNYTTFYGGKYLNEYGSDSVGGVSHIPEGYDWWMGLVGNSRYFNYTLSINGSRMYYENLYLTDVLANSSLDFLDNKLSDKPFFMMVATPAPHEPFTPADRHRNTFPDAKAIRNPSFNYSSNDKHWIVQMPPTHLPADVQILDDAQRHRLQSLLAVDEMVERIIGKLEDLKQLENTYIIFMSDHGFHIGQFTQPWDKRQPYEADIRVPLIISGPNVSANFTEIFPVSWVDIAPTILDLADVEVPSYMDGNSFKEVLLSSQSKTFESNVFLEYWGEGSANGADASCPWTYDSNVILCKASHWCKCEDSKNNTYSCVMTLSESQKFKYCAFNDDQNFREAYNLTSDPYELLNVYEDMDSEVVDNYDQLLGRFHTCQGHDCQL